MAEPIKDVESALFGHMLMNAFIGFVKAGVVAVAVGAAVGATLFALGLPPDLIPNPIRLLAGNDVLAGAIAGGALCLFPAGAIGATAAIQSSRDARRYMRIHEAARSDALLPPEQDRAAGVLEEIAPERKASYRDRLRTEAHTPTQTGIQL